MKIELYHIINKDQEVKGFLDYHYCSELEEVAQYNVYEVLEDNYIEGIDYICIYVHGSRVFRNPRKNSDIDFVLFYKGSIREDDLFNIFADENIYIEHAKCDFNPIKINDDSDIEYYILKHDVEYHLKPVLEKKINLALALDDFDDEETVLNIKSKLINHRDYTGEYLDLMKDVIDLGLPSGTLWCKYNLGVNLNLLLKPEDWYGDYYAWGELKPNKTFRDFIYFYYDNYKWYDKLTSKYTKYNKQDNLIKLLPEDDAAYQFKKCHNFKFYIPTKEQCEELINCTKNYWIRNYDPNKLVHNPKDDKGIQDLNGTLFISKINNAELFIPDANYYDNENNGHNKDSYIGKKRYDSTFWTAYPNLSNYNLAWAYIFFVDDDILYGGSTTKARWSGLPIRPVTIYKIN